MSTLQKVFLVVGVLVLIFLLWQLFFNNGGVLQIGWNALAGVVNGSWDKITGGNTPLMPLWGTASQGGGTTLGNNGF